MRRSPSEMSKPDDEWYSMSLVVGANELFIDRTGPSPVDSAARSPRTGRPKRVPPCRACKETRTGVETNLGSIVWTEAVRAGPAEVGPARATQRQRHGRRRLEVGELAGPTRERAQADGRNERAVAECPVVAGPRRLEDHVAVQACRTARR